MHSSSNIDIIDRLLYNGAKLPEEKTYDDEEEEHLPKNLREEALVRLINIGNTDIIRRLFTNGQFNCNSIYY